MTTEQWRYLKGGRAAHLLRVGILGLPLDAQCGVEVSNVHEWRGTSTAYERWQVTLLPKCRNCLATKGTP